MSNAQDLSLPALGNNFTFGGASGNWDGQNFDVNTFSNNLETQYVGGPITSFGTLESPNSYDGVVDQHYEGFMVDYGAVVATGFSSITSNTMINNQPLAPWPKDQKIYYKMVGYNTNTQTFETWIIVENIVDRVETFGPTNDFPNIDYGVFFTPPSGNPLVNIKIVGRWIQ